MLAKWSRQASVSSWFLLGLLILLLCVLHAGNKYAWNSQTDAAPHQAQPHQQIISCGYLILRIIETPQCFGRAAGVDEEGWNSTNRMVLFLSGTWLADIYAQVGRIKQNKRNERFYRNAHAAHDPGVSQSGFA